MKTLLAFIAALGIAASPITPAAEKYDPYSIDKRTFKNEYQRIALAPIEAGAALDMPDPAKQMIEEEITKHLEKRGFTVIPSAVLADIRKTMIDQVGGLSDPATGETDMEKVMAVHSHSLRELWYRHDFDALGAIRIQIIQAPIENDKAEWDGTSQKIKKKGGGLKYTASVAASSVTFSIYDASEQPLYVNYGGLEVLMMRVKQEFQPLDSSEYFKDEKRIRKAAQVAIKPI
jgi:hypothetical protein